MTARSQILARLQVAAAAVEQLEQIGATVAGVQVNDHQALPTVQLRTPGAIAAALDVGRLRHPAPGDARLAEYLGCIILWREPTAGQARRQEWP